jgi:hypothetical protein
MSAHIDDNDKPEYAHEEHLHTAEYDGEKGQHQVADTEAADYVDPTLVISEAENKRLKKQVFKKYVRLDYRC